MTPFLLADTTITVTRDWSISPFQYVLSLVVYVALVVSALAVWLRWRQTDDRLQALERQVHYELLIEHGRRLAALERRNARTPPAAPSPEHAE